MTGGKGLCDQVITQKLLYEESYMMFIKTMSAEYFACFQKISFLIGSVKWMACLESENIEDVDYYRALQSHLDSLKSAALAINECLLYKTTQNIDYTSTCVRSLLGVWNHCDTPHVYTCVACHKFIYMQIRDARDVTVFWCLTMRTPYDMSDMAESPLDYTLVKKFLIGDRNYDMWTKDAIFPLISVVRSSLVAYNMYRDFRKLLVVDTSWLSHKKMKKKRGW